MTTKKNSPHQPRQPIDLVTLAAGVAVAASFMATPMGQSLLSGRDVPAAVTAEDAAGVAATPPSVELAPPVPGDLAATPPVAGTPTATRSREPDPVPPASLDAGRQDRLPRLPLASASATDARRGSAAIGAVPNPPVPAPRPAPAFASLTLGPMAFEEPMALAAGGTHVGRADWPMLPIFATRAATDDPAADAVVAETSVPGEGRHGLPAVVSEPVLMALAAGRPVLDVLFAPPSALALPIPPIDKQSDVIVQVETADKLIEVFDDEDFSWHAVREGHLDAVPRVFVSTFPDDIHQIDAIELRKRVFFDTLLPLVLAVNEEILADRERLQAMVANIEAGVPPTTADARWLAALSEAYEVGPDIDALLPRVDVVPPSMALAQAAVESGWGTSRLARRGNALFGQIVASGADGIPAADGDHGFAAFETLRDSTAAYAMNLNTHFAYDAFREARAAQRAAGEMPDGYALMGELTAYSELGHEYIDYIRVVIRANDLQAFDRTRLRAPEDTEEATAGGWPPRLVPSMTDEEEARRGPALRRLTASGAPA